MQGRSSLTVSPLRVSIERVLFLSSTREDYLADSIFHGLRTLLGDRVVDYPKAELLYKGRESANQRRMHGNAFTLYGLLDDIALNRVGVIDEALDGKFDAIVIGDIWRSFGYYTQLAPELPRERLIVLDGADSAHQYPYSRRWLQHHQFWLLPRVSRGTLYFKRELSAETLHYRYYKLLPRALCQRLPLPPNVRSIGFSIPAEKIVEVPPSHKERLFARHVVDPEVAVRIEGARTTPVFDSEEEYFAELRRSRFGITTKRAGWECLRHYEIAANGCVPCFRDLERKPPGSAPHGLGPDNCVIYGGYEDLIGQIDAMDEAQYRKLQANALAWARSNTTTERARQLLAAAADWIGGSGGGRLA